MRSDALVLVAASLLRVPSRRLRALALGDEGALRDWLANESATRLAEARRDARLAAAHMLAAGARVVSIADPDYPGGLKALRDAPPFLIARGETPRTPWPEGVAIVGSRDAEPEPQQARPVDRLASGGARRSSRRGRCRRRHQFLG